MSYWVLLFMIPYDFIGIAAQGLIDAGRDFNGAQICYSKEHPELMKAAREHAKYQAQQQIQGHQNWERRRHSLIQKLPGYNFEEVCAESWPWETNESMYIVGKSMFEAWVQTGHWKIVSKQHDIFGVGMALGENGIWYACIIVGDK